MISKNTTLTKNTERFLSFWRTSFDGPPTQGVSIRYGVYGRPGPVYRKRRGLRLSPIPETVNRYWRTPRPRYKHFIAIASALTV